jgi:hypothetical protein
VADLVHPPGQVTAEPDVAMDREVVFDLAPGLWWEEPAVVRTVDFLLVAQGLDRDELVELISWLVFVA